MTITSDPQTTRSSMNFSSYLLNQPSVYKQTFVPFPWQHCSFNELWHRNLSKFFWKPRCLLASSLQLFLYASNRSHGLTRHARTAGSAQEWRFFNCNRRWTWQFWDKAAWCRSGFTFRALWAVKLMLLQQQWPKSQSTQFL